MGISFSQLRELAVNVLQYCRAINLYNPFGNKTNSLQVIEVNPSYSSVKLNAKESKSSKNF